MRHRTQQEMGEKIAELRGEMTQAQLAEALAIDRSAMSRVESGERSLNLAELLAAAALLGVDPNVLLYDDEPVFAMRADADQETIGSAMAACTKVIHDHRLLRIAAGR